MRYQLLGHSGLRVSELCLGTMTFGEEWGWGSSRDESRRVFEAFVEAGGNFFDTADGYTNGTSEKMLGEFVREARERCVLATKYSFNARRGDPNAGGNHRKNLVQALEGSLKRLGVEYIDLYWLHAWDELTPVDEVMRALDDVVRQGKVLYVGVSNVPAWWIARANTLAELRGWTRFVGLQLEYSLVERTPERDMLPMARALELGVAAWSPLASGLLSGKYTRTKSGAGDKRLEKASFVEQSERNLAIARAVDAVADELGRSSAQVALAWVRAQGRIVPILGARTAKQLQDNLGCLDVSLSPAQLARLEAASSIALGYPHEFLRRPGVHDFLHGGTFEAIDR